MSPGLMSLGLIGYLALLAPRIITAVRTAHGSDDPYSLRRARAAVVAFLAFTGLLGVLAPSLWTH